MKKVIKKLLSFELFFKYFTSIYIYKKKKISGFKSNATFDLENVRILFSFWYDYWRQVISVDEEKWLS